MKKNSGGAGVPKNIGMKLSRGKYLFFIDSDDAITKSALNELYQIAENFHADVVDCEKFYPVQNNLWQNKDNNPNVLKVNFNPNHVKTPTLIENDLVTRVTHFRNKRFPYPLWTKFINRDFLAKNNLEMINSRTSEDLLLTFSMLCLAERYVLVPNIVNFYRIHEKSISHQKISVEQMINIHTDALKKGIPYLEKFFESKDILIKHKDLKFTIFEVLFQESFFYLANTFTKVPLQQLDEIIRREFEKISDKTALTAFLFSRMNIFNVNLIQQNLMIQQLQAQLQK